MNHTLPQETLYPAPRIAGSYFVFIVSCPPRIPSVHGAGVSLFDLRFGRCGVQTSSRGITGQAQRQARQYRQEEKEILGTSFPSASGTILITPWRHASAQAPQ